MEHRLKSLLNIILVDINALPSYEDKNALIKLYNRLISTVNMNKQQAVKLNKYCDIIFLYILQLKYPHKQIDDSNLKSLFKNIDFKIQHSFDMHLHDNLLTQLEQVNTFFKVDVGSIPVNKDSYIPLPIGVNTSTLVVKMSGKNNLSKVGGYLVNSDTNEKTYLEKLVKDQEKSVDRIIDIIKQHIGRYTRITIIWDGDNYNDGVGDKSSPWIQIMINTAQKLSKKFTVILVGVKQEKESHTGWKLKNVLNWVNAGNKFSIKVHGISQSLIPVDFSEKIVIENKGIYVNYGSNGITMTAQQKKDLIKNNDEKYVDKWGRDFLNLDNTKTKTLSKNTMKTYDKNMYYVENTGNKQLTNFANSVKNTHDKTDVGNYLVIIHPKS